MPALAVLNEDAMPSVCWQTVSRDPGGDNGHFTRYSFVKAIPDGDHLM